MSASFLTSTTSEHTSSRQRPSDADSDVHAACNKVGLPSLRTTFVPIFKHLHIHWSHVSNYKTVEMVRYFLAMEYPIPDAPPVITATC